MADSHARRRGGMAWLAVGAALLAASTPVGADAPEDRYMIVAAQGLVTDLRTRLTWQQTPDNAVYGWAAAAAYCRGLTPRGAFRLPTLKELLTLVDPVRVRPAIDLKAFPNTSTDWFWTSSNRNAAGPAAVSFETGASSFFAATDSLRVRCVR